MDTGLFAVAFQTIFSLQGVLLIAGGVVIGIIAGIIPGLTSSVALGLLLPITFVLPKGVKLTRCCSASIAGPLTAVLFLLSF